ncbi:helix-turn-helix transcriptional regulator [Halomonas sp. 18071143]|uniref:helix-turn-helix transcriptional regulator n=1 Tax=Halomonas sp. 18071143 TaxID=2855441 RepID=UPI0035296769
MCQLTLKEGLVNVQRFDGRHLGRWRLGAGGSQQPRPEVGRGVLAAGERRIKRVQRLAGGALYLISDNDHYQPEMIKPQDMHDVEILGRCVVRIGRVV